MTRTTEKSNDDLAFIIDLIYDRARIRMDRGKESLIRARLGKRMRKLGYEDFHSYCQFLKSQADEEEITHVVDALTTNFTHFLREETHFQFLVKQALPALLKPGQKKFQVWSAACATGEEPYSLAMYLSEYFPPAAGWDWRIQATDISTKALTTATGAIYPINRLESVPNDWIKRYFQRGHNEWDGYCRVKPLLTSRVDFKHLNLLGDYRMAETYEVIFCRNVMIYFDRPTQQQLASHLGTHLVPKGYLLVGHSESLNGLTLPFKCIKPSIYQHT